MAKVETDMRAHTVTVAFDDAEVELSNIVQALAVAGYTVPDYRKVAAPAGSP